MCVCVCAYCPLPKKMAATSQIQTLDEAVWVYFHVIFPGKAMYRFLGWLVGFYDISTIVGYLMQNLYLYK